MKIVGVELRELAVDLQFRFETSFGVEQDLRKLILVLRADGLEGYGEVTAGTVPGYSYETTATAWTALHDYVLPRVVGRTFATPSQLLAAVGNVRGHNMAVAALETAFWDLQAKAAGMPLWQLLGGVRTEIEVGASLGIQGSVEETVDIARQHLDQGYRRLKFKIKPGWEVEPLSAVREALPDASLTVDANSAYSLNDVAIFHRLDELDLDYIEQPLAHDDLVDHAALQDQLTTAICLDESIHSAADARKALALGSGRVINLKLGRVRGHLESRRVHDVALAFHAPVWCGGMLELGIGRAHNLHLSTLENFTLPGDTASATRYWGQEDIIDQRLDAVDGIQRVPEDGPGLGISLRRDLIERLTVRSAVL